MTLRGWVLAVCPIRGARRCGSTLRLRELRAARSVVVDEANELERRLPRDVDQAHRAAVAAGRERYVDPQTGRAVMTRHFHMQRGICCGRRCRHCPYGHVNVPALPPGLPEKENPD